MKKLRKLTYQHNTEQLNETVDYSFDMYKT